MPREALGHTFEGKLWLSTARWSFFFFFFFFMGVCFRCWLGVLVVIGGGKFEREPDDEDPKVPC